jgi:hypothetical protein
MTKKVTGEKNPTIGEMSRNLNFKKGIKTPTHVSGISTMYSKCEKNAVNLYITFKINTKEGTYK